MEQIPIKSPEDIRKVYEARKAGMKKIFNAEAMKLANEIFERESEFFEFNLFISSIGNKEIDMATEDIRSLRKQRLDLSKYEEMAEKF